MKKPEVSYKITGEHINGMVYRNSSNGKIFFRTMNECHPKGNFYDADSKNSVFIVGENAYISIDYYNDHLITKEGIVLDYDQFKILMDEMKQIEDAFESLKVMEEISKEK